MGIWQNLRTLVWQIPPHIQKCFSSVSVSNRNFTERETVCRLSVWMFLNLTSVNVLLIVMLFWFDFIPFPVQRPSGGVASQQIVSSANAKKLWVLWQLLPRPRFNRRDGRIYEEEIYTHFSSQPKSVCFLKNSCELHRPRMAVRHKGWKIYYFF